MPSEIGTFWPVRPDTIRPPFTHQPAVTLDSRLRDPRVSMERGACLVPERHSDPVEQAGRRVAQIVCG
jgi:hypothetical protein